MAATMPVPTVPVGTAPRRQAVDRSPAGIAAHYAAGTAAGQDMSWMKTQGIHNPAATANNLNAYTPPKPKGNSWLGVDPKQTMSAGLAKEGLEGYLGGSVAPHMPRIQQILASKGYTDQSFATDLTGEQYNALLEEGANLTGNTFTPYSTTGPGNAASGTPPPTTAGGTPPPTLDLPDYNAPDPFRFNGEDLRNDPGYAFELAEGQRALQHAQSAKGGIRGTNTMRDLIGFSQGMASTRFNDAFNRAGQTWDRNTGDNRYGHESRVNKVQTEYAPQLLGWERDRDERRRDVEMNFDRDWQREVFGRDDAWRRHTYANDDVWRRYQLEEDRRNRAADRGRV